MIIVVFTFFRSSRFSGDRTRATSSFSCRVSLAANAFMASLFPFRTARNTSSTSHVHHTCDPARPTIPITDRSHLIRGSLA